MQIIRMILKLVNAVSNSLAVKALSRRRRNVEFSTEGNEMNIIMRLSYALRYDFDPNFVTYAQPGNMLVRFRSYDEAKRFSDRQIQYRPKVFISVSRPGNELGPGCYKPMDILPAAGPKAGDA